MTSLISGCSAQSVASRSTSISRVRSTIGRWYVLTPAAPANDSSAKCPPSLCAKCTNPSPRPQVPSSTACSATDPPLGRQSKVAASKSCRPIPVSFPTREALAPESGNAHSPASAGYGGANS
ncbi:hypothetical protein SF12_06715 [Streptomyces sp. MBRL 601]|nr:hypothetical protein SF12_06715 [Streptomyces sp. MBRL 601]